MRVTPISAGTPAPWFICRSLANPAYNFSTVAGRYVVLCFYGSAGDPASARVLKDFIAARSLFDDDFAAFFGVSADPQDLEQKRIEQLLPGIRYLLDFGLDVSRLYGVVPAPGEYRRTTFVLDSALRVIASLPISGSGDDHCEKVVRLLKAIPERPKPSVVSGLAPVLTVPYVFEADLCRKLIQAYEQTGGSDSGFMEDRGGKTVGVIDYGHKKRRDMSIDDKELRAACVSRLDERLVPAIRRAYQFNVTRLERHIVSCYDAEEGGYFRAHRDNTTKATAYRRFAVSLFLNSGEYEGGFLRFPEFGNHLYTAPPGAAIVFSCSMLHEATPVTKGKRYMYLPFLWDDEADKLREENLRYRTDEILRR